MSSGMCTRMMASSPNTWPACVCACVACARACTCMRACMDARARAWPLDSATATNKAVADNEHILAPVMLTKDSLTRSEYQRAAQERYLDNEPFVDGPRHPSKEVVPAEVRDLSKPVSMHMHRHLTAQRDRRVLEVCVCARVHACLRACMRACMPDHTVGVP